MGFYFDSASTTAVRKDVLESMMPYLSSSYGNPSSKFRLGYEAKQAVEYSRKVIADMIGADLSEIFFTSGGSEANTWAIRGFKRNYVCATEGEYLTTPIEHHSVLNAADRASFLDVNMFGRVNTDDLKNKIKGNTALVATMLVNNEIGTIEPVEDFAPICADRGVFYHVDAVQAFGHIPFNVHDPEMEGITTLSMSGHKIGAPKGVGALYIRKDIQAYYHPLICGGQQESGLRGGTENVASIVGFAKATELAKQELTTENYYKIKGKAIYAWDFIKSNIPNVRINGLPLIDNHRVANNLNVSFEGINGEELVAFLDQYDICVSTGSACNSDSAEPSHVLKAIGLTDDQANSSIRMSFSLDNKLVDVNFLCEKLAEGVKLLRG